MLVLISSLSVDIRCRYSARQKIVKTGATPFSNRKAPCVIGADVGRLLFLLGTCRSVATAGEIDGIFEGLIDLGVSMILALGVLQGIGDRPHEGCVLVVEIGVCHARETAVEHDCLQGVELFPTIRLETLESGMPGNECVEALADDFLRHGPVRHILG